MHQLLDQPGARTCAKGTLRNAMCIGGLVMGAVLASVLLVDPQNPAGHTTEGQSPPPYVPASDTWVELGATEDTTPPLQAAILDRAATPERQVEQRRKSRASS